MRWRTPNTGMDRPKAKRPRRIHDSRIGESVKPASVSAPPIRATDSKVRIHHGERRRLGFEKALGT
jgi:hypothetical protein